MPTTKIPEGFSSITPTLVVNDAAQAIDQYTKAFSAKEIYRMNCPNSGKIMHACIQLGSSKLFLCDVNPEMGATSSNFYLFFDDVDTTFRQATQAGLQEISPVQDMFWGDRTGSVKDQFGNKWTIATHVRDVSPQEIEEAKKNFGSKAA